MPSKNSVEFFGFRRTVCRFFPKYRGAVQREVRPAARSSSSMYSTNKNRGRISARDRTRRVTIACIAVMSFYAMGCDSYVEQSRDGSAPFRSFKVLSMRKNTHGYAARTIRKPAKSMRRVLGVISGPPSRLSMSHRGLPRGPVRTSSRRRTKVSSSTIRNVAFLCFSSVPALSTSRVVSS